MIKIFWYTYFVVYLIISSFSRIKVFFLRKKDPKAADLYAYKRIRAISKHVIKKSKTTVEVIGAENILSEPCVFVGNHQAIYDAFVLIYCINTPTGFIAKKEITKIPLIYGWLKSTHSVFLDRSNIKDGIRAINEGVDNLSKGFSMIIFPEGTRSLASNMGEFKKGSIKLALKANAPIVPFTLDGTYKVLEVGNQVRGHKVTIKFHKPIYTSELSKEDQKSINETVYSIVSNGLQEIIEKK